MTERAPDSELPKLVDPPHPEPPKAEAPNPTPTTLTTLTGSQMRDSELPIIARATLAPDSKRGQRIALAILLVLTFLVAAWIASGLWVGIALGMVMAFTAQPAFRALARRIGDRRAIAAGVVTVAMGLFTGGLGALFLYIAVDELVTIGGLLEHKLQAGSLAAMVGEPVAKVIDKLGMSRSMVLTRIHHGLEEGATYAAGSAAGVVQAATGAVLGLMLALLTMYYVLLEWRTLIVRIEQVLPLNPRHTRALILEFREVGRGVLVGTVATAMVQGVLGGVAYAVLGVPQALTWGIATGFGSFLPVVGTGIVWGPVGAYLILNGQPFAGNQRGTQKHSQQAGVDRMANTSIRAAAHQLVVDLERDLTTPVAAQMQTCPDGKAETRDFEDAAGRHRDGPHGHESPQTDDRRNNQKQGDVGE